MSLPDAYFTLFGDNLNSCCYQILFHWLKAIYNIINAFNSRSFFNLDNENGVEDTPRLIDRKVNLHILKPFCTVCF